MSSVPPPRLRVDNPIVFLDVQVGDEFAGRLLIELRADVVPRTAENFRRLCTGETTSEKTGKRRHYARCPFHRVVKGKFCQSGDFINHDGSGGESTFDAKSLEMNGGAAEDDKDAWSSVSASPATSTTALANTFEDENFILRHTGVGVLSMVNAGPDSNTSQFYLHFAPRPEFDGEHVVFGCLADQESFEVLIKIEAVATERGDSKLPVRIRRCGQLVSS